MSERKVLNKYFPKNFNHEILVKRGRGKDKLMMVRNMLPMSLRCNSCSNYLYIGTKFNMRMQICNNETYLDIKVFRFYLKCTYCYNDITFKTDPKNHDYVVELGGTRNYQPIRDAQQAQKLIRKTKKDQKQGDSMKFLQNRTYDSKRQMELNEALEDIKNLNKRQSVIDPQELLKNLIYEEVQENEFTEQQQLQIQRHYQQLRKKILQQKGKLPKIQEQRQCQDKKQQPSVLDKPNIKIQAETNLQKKPQKAINYASLKANSKLYKTKKISKPNENPNKKNTPQEE